MNELVVRESILQLREQKQSLYEVIRNHKKGITNAQLNEDQLGLRMNQEGRRLREMQEAHRLSENQIQNMCRKFENRMIQSEDLKRQLGQVTLDGKNHDITRKVELESWQDACRSQADEFQRANDLFFDKVTLDLETTNMAQCCQEIELSIARIERNEQQLSDEMEGGVALSVNFLLEPAAAEAFHAFAVNTERENALLLELDGLKQQETHFRQFIAK